MHPGLIETAVALIGLGFGLGGLARFKQKGSRGAADLISAWGLVVCGLFLAVHGVFAWQGWIDWP